MSYIAQGVSAGSELERSFATLLRFHKMPKPETQHRFHETRKWSMDFAWPSYMVAVEVEGGVWVSGRHVRGAGFINDCAKYNEAALDGWLVLRVTREQVESGQAIEWLRSAMQRAIRTRGGA